MITQEQVLAVLKTIIYPGFQKDIVSFGFVKDITLQDYSLALRVEIPSSNPAVAKELEDSIKAGLDKLGIENANIDIKMPSLKQETKAPISAKNIAPTIKHFVMISSGKGGVGKSTTSVNLAISLAKSGLKVGLLDADIYGPNIPRMMGIQDMQPGVSEDGKNLLPIQALGISVMSIGLLYESAESLIWRGPMVMRAIEQMLKDVVWDELDVLVIDMPPGTGDAQLTLAQNVPVSAGVNVSTPQAVAIDDGARALDMFKKLNIPIFGVVENMSGFVCPDTNKVYDIFGSGGCDKLASNFDTEVVARIPLQPSIVTSSDDGRPISYYSPDSLASKIYMNLADKLIDFLKDITPSNATIQPTNN
ncbi:Mrp/NBP35 family ATP-binding protein [Helicobacter sp. 11S02629-2]|uniref:Mrp/NBP35 family ATP-binding protein n=1 Tax=Helicobacter sp. 11S02629-2 TaxID=1476195 RepID=UPI000BA60FF7|nr:Mrp/NBP35 family ATP-binding protein [Helicobacter sp. 11S02629-2]PAF45444.1 sodium:proton antiporter [Helicobacter sp. 11S02629-2]